MSLTLLVLGLLGCAAGPSSLQDPEVEQERLEARRRASAQEHGMLPGKPLVGVPLEVEAKGLYKGYPEIHSSVFCYTEGRVVRPATWAGPVWIEYPCEWLDDTDLSWLGDQGRGCLRPHWGLDHETFLPRLVSIPRSAIDCSEVRDE